MDSAIYVDGQRTDFLPLEQLGKACGEKGGFAWTGLFEPSKEEFASVTREFDLHELAVEDAIEAH